MKILFLLDEWPIPATSGSKVHDKIMMRCLTEDWEAHLGYWLGSNERLTELDASSAIVFPRRRMSWRSFPGALFGLLFRRKALHAAEFLTAPSRQKLRESVEAILPDIIILSCPRLAVIVPFLKTVSGAKIIVDTHDVHVQRCKSILKTLPKTAVRERVMQVLLIRSYTIVEKEIYKQVDVAWALKKEDKKLLESFDSVLKVDIVPNVVDPDMLQDASNITGEIDNRYLSCVFIGDYSYNPNEQCALALIEWFSSALLQATGATLYLIGVNPTASMTRAANGLDKIKVTGRVSDLSDYLRPVDTIFLVPLLAGGGVKRKVIEAMACGCPVITTEVGAEGLDLVDGVMAEIRDIGSFPETIVRLAENRDQRIRLASNGQEHINSHFGYQKVRDSVRRSLLNLA